MRVREIIAEPLIVHGVASGRQADARVEELLALTGLPASAADRYPHAFSGGQRQRIGIARALALGPELIIADEPVSALDVSIQAQVINLLEDVQRTLGVAYLFIGHDLSVVRHISDRIAIMYAGQIVEISDSDSIFDSTLHPYTESLLSALPIADPEVAATKKRIILSGEVPSPIAPPPGCRFFSRCPYAQPQRCELEQPVLRESKPGHLVACHYAEDIEVGTITRADGDGALASFITGGNRVVDGGESRE
jgi:oligopeptide/dipeptide ABC transporter ATP-binding protein